MAFHIRRLRFSSSAGRIPLFPPSSRESRGEGNLGCFSLFLRFSLARHIPLLPLTRESAVGLRCYGCCIMERGGNCGTPLTRERKWPLSPCSGQGSYEFTATTTRCLRARANGRRSSLGERRRRRRHSDIPTVDAINERAADLQTRSRMKDGGEEVQHKLLELSHSSPVGT